MSELDWKNRIMTVLLEDPSREWTYTDLQLAVGALAPPGSFSTALGDLLDAGQVIWCPDKNGVRRYVAAPLASNAEGPHALSARELVAKMLAVLTAASPRG